MFTKKWSGQLATRLLGCRWAGFVLLAVIGIGSDQVYATTLYWSGGGTWDNGSTSNWGTASGGPYDQSAWNNAPPDTAIFQGTAGTVTLGEAITAAGVTFEVDGYTLDSSTLTLSTTGTGITATGSATIDSAVAVSGNQSWSVASGKTLTINGAVSGASTITYGGGGTYVINGINTNTANLTLDGTTVSVSGGGTLYGTGAGWVKRTVTLSNGGTLVATNFSNGGGNFWGNIGDDGNNVIFGENGGTFRMTGTEMNSTVNKGFTVNAGVTGVFEIPAGVTSEWLGNYSSRDFLSNSGSTLEFALDGDFTTSRYFRGAGGFTKTGAGTLTIQRNNNSFSGPLVVSAGTYDVAVGTTGGNASGIGNGSGTNTVTVESGALLLFSSGDRTSGYHSADATINGGTITFNTADNSFAVGRTISFDSAAGTIGGTGQLRRRSAGNKIAVTAAASGSVVSVGDLNLLDSSPVFEVADGAQADDLTISGSLSGGATLTKTGTGTLAVTADNSSFTGGIAVNAGTLRTGHANALGGSGTVTVGSTLDLSGTGLAINGLAGSGTVTNGGVAAATLTAGGGNATTTFSGTLQDGVGALSLAKAGTGTLTLTSANTFTGNTTINAGTLFVSNVNALGTAGTVSIDAAGTLGIGAGLAFTRPLSIASGGKVALGDGASVTLPDAAALAAFETASGAGSLTSAEILYGSGVATPSVSSSWTANSGEFFSDILSLDGTGTGNIYVLSMSYDGAAPDPTGLNIGYRAGTSGEFTNVGTSSQGSVAWNSGFTTVGQYGVDTTSGTVWVVTDHNSQFVVVPEPAVGLAAAASCAGIVAGLWRRRRRG